MMATSPKGVDRRARRTQQMLLQAFIEVAQEKGITAVSIQDITERANVHRGTFYAHFTDKSALVYALIREEVHRVLTNKLLPISQWDHWTLQQLIRNVLENFTRVHHQCHPSHILDPLIERATHEVLTEILVTWLKQSSKKRETVPIETMAQLMSWTIFGAAVEWSQEPGRRTSGQMAHDVWLVITEGIARLAPDALSE